MRRVVRGRRGTTHHNDRMPADAWLTLAVIVALGVALATERVPPTVAMGSAVLGLYLVGVLDAPGAFGGFSNIAPITVAALYVIAGAADITGAMGGLTARVLGRPDGVSERRLLARLGYPVTLASGFMPNTPLVAMFAPRVSAWARRAGRSPSRFLLPLSYASILGGVITLLGTSTNLVVSGLLDAAGEPRLGVFEITPVGLPIALIGVSVLVLVVPRLLRTRQGPDEDLASIREFTIEMVVAPGSPLAGQTVAGANLRNLQGVYLVEILRSGHRVSPVAPEEVLGVGDRLVFVGEVDRVVDLQGIAGLVLAEEHHFTQDREVGRRFYEAVVAESSPLNGSTLKATGFRAAYGAAVVAVHRADHRLGGQLGDLPLRNGDVLLLVGPEGFEQTRRRSSDFSVIAPYAGGSPVRRRSAHLVELAIVALVVLAGTGLVDLTKAAVGVALALVATRVITPTAATRSINLNIIAMIAFSLGLGAAAATSGLAAEASANLLGLTERFGDHGIVFGIALGTLLATELLSNNAAAALVFPVALTTALETGLDIRPLALVILVMASCSFLTPIGYQTNTMVFGMGGYRFTDFTRVGLPLTIVTLVLTVALVPLAFPLR
ncbi:SLC13 family permease [soil metagenome]